MSDSTPPSESNPQQPKYALLHEGTREQRRLDRQQEMMQAIIGPLLPAPIALQEGDEVLDSATGTGAWALALAADRPDVRLTGIDINPRFFPPNPPQNITFEQQSVLSLPPSWAGLFKAIHQRYITSALSLPDWAAVLTELWRVSKPGGWVVLEEFSATLHPPSASPETLPANYRILRYALAFAKQRGVDLNVAERLASMLRERGWKEVREERRVLPLGPGVGAEGMRVNFEAFWRHSRGAVKGTQLEMSDEAFERMLSDARKESEANEVGWEMRIVLARKP